jgi:hypothetical protein
MAIALTSTRYLFTTDDLLGGWDEKFWIQSSDDAQGPDTSALSFDELEAAAVSGGSGSDAEKVRNKIIAVLSEEARKGEQWVESFCFGIYNLPLNPCDGVAKDLMVDWMVHRARIRKDMYKSPEVRINAETGLFTRGKGIRMEMNRLSAVRPGIGEGLNESIAAFGGEKRRDAGNGPFGGVSRR